MAKENNINKTTFTIEVDREALESVRNEPISQIEVYINDENQCQLLENIDGHLILATDDLPDTYHDCYYHNDGKFPYIINPSLQFLDLACGDDLCRTRIIRTETKASTRFRFQGPGQPSIEDPNGDSCIWRVTFFVKPVSTYLLRWNPSISSFKLETYREATAECPDGFGLNWSIYEWEQAQAGDIYYMVRVGDDKAGIFFRGEFRSDPYSDKDWSGRGKQRKYVDITCLCCAPYDGDPWLSIEELTKAIPEINWGAGHSGEKLPSSVASKLARLWNEKVTAISSTDC